MMPICRPPISSFLPQMPAVIVDCWVKLVQTAALINLSYQKKKKNNELKCK
jgi:hypothetical protein